MNRYLIIFLILFSCKSTSKIIEQSNRIDEEIITINKNEIITDIGNVTKKTIITETNIIKYEPVKGTDIIKPVTTKTITTEIKEVQNKNKFTSKLSQKNNLDLSSFDTLSLDKQTEGMEVLEEIVGGITGGFIGDFAKYFISAIFFIILLIFIVKFIKSLKKQEN